MRYAACQAMPVPAGSPLSRVLARRRHRVWRLAHPLPHRADEGAQAPPMQAQPAEAQAPPMKAPPGGAFRKVSTLVQLPEFLPGLGILYVDPRTLPAGPFLAYDRQG